TPDKREVGSSSLPRPTIVRRYRSQNPEDRNRISFWLLFSGFRLLAAADRGHSSVGRAPALQAGGRRFDPVWLHQHPSLFAEIRAHLSVRNRAQRFNAQSRACCKSQVLHELVSSRCIFYIVKRGLT